ncbi:MAG TPA: AtpZ/AtpI family protein [Vicinamibacterales bacterium]|nr:AtpZ/AtpI family protein [Vicinamibacterales bacterium]
MGPARPAPVSGVPSRETRGGSRGDFLLGSAKQLQKNLRAAGPAAAASYALIGAIILLGGIGYLCDRWLGTEPWLLLTGLIAGIIVGFYELARMIWR